MQESEVDQAVVMEQLPDDWNKANKKQLLAKLLPTLAENARLKDSVDRLLKKHSTPPIVRHLGRSDDFVPVGWIERHGIDVPRADGYFESPVAWVRIVHGVITNAGLKNQSLLSVMIARDILDSGAEHHAKLYKDWRAAFFARHEAARYSDVGSGDPDAWSKEDRFSKLLRAVERKTLRYIDAIVAPNPKEKHLASLNTDPAPFVKEFSVLARAINQINGDADDALKAIREGKAHDAGVNPQ